MMKKKYWHYFLISIVVLFIYSFFSCGSGPGDTGIGATASIQIEYFPQDPYYDYPSVEDPWPIPADGSSSILIKITLNDASGNPVYISTPVTFITNLGHFPGGTQSYWTETIDDSGIIYVHLISGTTPGVAFLLVHPITLHRRAMWFSLIGKELMFVVKLLKLASQLIQQASYQME